jgi:general secretion pathway protein J
MRIIKSSSEHGFTLVEVLIAFALLTMICTAVGTALHRVGLSWERGSTAITHNNEMRRTHQLLRAWLASARWASSRVEGQRINYFRGTSDGVQFALESTQYLPMAGWQLIEIDVSRESATRTLSLRYEPLYPKKADSPQRESQAVMLATNLKSVRFEYFGSIVGGAAKRWTDDWTERSVLPELVRMRVIATSERPWPDLTVRINSRAKVLVSTPRGSREESTGSVREYALDPVENG